MGGAEAQSHVEGGEQDIEDRRDAWEEYAGELHKERGKYVSYMSKRGYRVPQVYFENL